MRPLQHQHRLFAGHPGCMHKPQIRQQTRSSSATSGRLRLANRLVICQRCCPKVSLALPASLPLTTRTAQGGVAQNVPGPDRAPHCAHDVPGESRATPGKRRGDSGRQELQQGLLDQPARHRRHPIGPRRISGSAGRDAPAPACSHSQCSLHGFFAPTPHLRSFKLAANPHRQERASSPPYRPRYFALITGVAQLGAIPPCSIAPSVRFLHIGSMLVLRARPPSRRCAWLRLLQSNHNGTCTAH